MSNVLDKLVDRIEAARTLREKVAPDLRPLFDHRLNLAKNYHSGSPQQAGIYLRSARKMAGETSRSRPTPAPRFGVEQVKIDRGGYDRSGRYWGIGSKLWEWEDSEGRTRHVRAATKADAIAKFKAGKY